MELIKRAAPGLAMAALFVASLAGFLVFRLKRAERQAETSRASARHFATHDRLTGLPNRFLLHTELARALEPTDRDQSNLALHYIDLDRFTRVNDTLGHLAGDELLRLVAQRLTDAVSATDIVARVGGDEFAILQREVDDQSEAEGLAAAIIETMRTPFFVCGESIFVEATVGIAMAPDHTADPFEIARMSNVALWAGRKDGERRYYMFEPALDEDASTKGMIERDLRDAITDGAGLRIVYQPIFTTDGTSIVGAEALVRWEHPIHGSISPALFIPVAEECGLIESIGWYVLRNACRTAKDLNLPWIAVNVSAVQLRDPEFLELVLDLLRDIGLSADRLQIEITEGILLDATDEVATTLADLRLAGVKVALDDFGTGYSSLHYLHRYKVDKIKIDRSFVRSLSQADDTAVVRAMFDLARALALDVTAEGVETQGQWEVLASLGDPELQGFLFSKPVGAAVLRELCARGLDAGYAEIQLTA